MANGVFHKTEMNLHRIIDQFEKSRDIIPEGIYTVQVNEVCLKKDEEKNSLVLHWTLEILMGEYSGRILRKIHSLDGNDVKSARKLTHLSV